MLYAEAMFSLAELCSVRQHPGDDLDIYLKRFRDKALDCCNLVAERMPVEVCLDGMLEEYHISLEKLFFSFFSKLLEAARWTNESVHRASRPCSSSRSNLNHVPRKRSIVVTRKKGEGSRLFSSKRPTNDRRGLRQFPTLSPFSTTQRRPRLS